VYFVNYGGLGNYSLHRIDPDGVIHTVVPLHASGVYGDGDVWGDAAIGGVIDMEVGPDGSVYLADGYPSVVRRLSPDGYLTTLSIPGGGYYACQEGPLGTTPLGNVAGLAIDAAGEILLTFNNASCVMRLTRDGMLERLAYLGQGGGVDVDASGTVYAVDWGSTGSTGSSWTGRRRRWRATPMGSRAPTGRRRS